MRAGERRLDPSREKEVFLVQVMSPGPVRDTRRDDQQALEEIRRLFARYRQIARHGQAIEREDPPDSRPEETKDVGASPAR